MASESHKVDLDLPVVRNRREFFEQESAIAGTDPSKGDDPSPEEAPDDMELHLREMREAAARRTGGGGEG
ncbi:MAG: hypothetical protein KY393_05570 [Actinobacteria bacterium]|nr:hypothetical protein [Actinomycetota bacterium]